MYYSILVLLLLLLGMFSPVTSAAAQTAGKPSRALSQNADSALAEATASLERAKKNNVDFLSPDHYARAVDAYKDVRKLVERNGEPDLIHIKTLLFSEEIDRARKSAGHAREKLSDLLSARSGAFEARADSLSKSTWEKAEVRSRTLLRDLERNPEAINQGEVNDVTGMYRAARREALRTQALREARDNIIAIEKRNGVKTVPILLLRAQQAQSRSEANLAQENLDTARVQGQDAAQIATHALALLDYADAAQKTKQPWENALLPYDDLLEEIAAKLGHRLDFSKGGARTGPQILSMIDSRQDSLLNLTATQQQTISSLEGSLAEAQTHLSESQARITELENRLKILDSTRTTNRAAEEKSQTLKDRMTRAQESFKPGEAEVLQDSAGNVMIRLAGTVFPAGATKLDKARQKIVDRVADAIALFPGASIRVEGYTDSTGEADQNVSLSQERAKAIADYLTTKLNAAPGQIKSEGYGASKFVESNETAAGRAKNRRIDLILATSGK